MRDLQGKIALVTGGAHSIGKAIAAELAARGAHVLINYFHSHEDAKATKAELEAAGAQVDLLRYSVARQDQAERMFAEIERRFGALDILVNNAANGGLVPNEDVTDEYMDKALDTNYKGSFRCSRLAAPLMDKRGGGAIVMLSALGCSQFVVESYMANAPAKAATSTLARYLAAEYASRNIRVNTATASLVVGKVAEAFPNAAAAQQVTLDATPMGRLCEPEDVARLVAFLVSDDARFITGQELVVDGGLSMGVGLFYPMKSKTTVEQPAEGTGDGGEVAIPEQSSPHGTGSASAGSNLPSKGESARAESAAAETVRDGESAVESGSHDDSAGVSEHPTSEDDEIAIVGMGIAVAGAQSPEEFWRLRMDGAELFVPVPEERWAHRNFLSSDKTLEDKSYQPNSAFIADSPATSGEAEEHEAQELTTRWLRQCLKQAVDGVNLRHSDRHSFIVGYTADGSQHLEEAEVIAGVQDRTSRLLGMDADAEPAVGSTLSTEQRAQLYNDVNEAVAQRYWRGAQTPASEFVPHRVGQRAMEGVLPDNTELRMVDTACSSSLYALDIGIKGLKMGKQDVAICGGSFADTARGSVLFSKLNGLSPSSELRSLDAAADGVVFADGAAVVVLKKLSKARADGDRILAVLSAVGSSSDGKGTAIYAPNPTGQSLAVQRAWSQADTDVSDVDWIIAHATGTPAGDLAEFSTLREYYGTGAGSGAVAVTSNKSLIGHTGWPAGVVSLIEAILGLQNDTIPPQHRFARTPEAFEIADTRLTVPTASRHWPPQQHRPRTAAISAFGFGGTNAHVIVREDHPRRRTTAKTSSAEHDDPQSSGRVAIVGLSAHVPDLSTEDELRQWLRGGSGPSASFGEFYPVPPFNEVRMPPPTARVIDRCQLMVLRCARELKEQLGELWGSGAKRAGVFVGNYGPTRHGMLYANRSYQDDIAQAVADHPGSSEPAAVTELMNALRDEVRRQVPPSTEDAFPGIMPNVISARVANYFDLNGPNMVLDSGLASGLTAMDVAQRYLAAGELDFAVVGGINGNSLPGYQSILSDLVDCGPEGLAEGAVMFALTTEDNAARFGLPILGYVESDKDTATGASRGGKVREVASPEYARYLGAAASVAAATALHGPAGRVTLSCHQGEGQPSEQLTLTVTGCFAKDVAESEPAEQVLPEQFRNTSEYSPGKRVQAARWTPQFRESAFQRGGEPTVFFAEGTVILTDQPSLLDGLTIPSDTAVLSTAPLAQDRPQWKSLPEITPEHVDAALQGLSFAVRHVRVLTDLGAIDPEKALLAGESSTTSLHDLAFLVMQQLFDTLQSSDAAVHSSFLVSALGARPSGTVHPNHGLLSALVKGAFLELTGCRVRGVFLAGRDVTQAIQLTEHETAAKLPFPIVVYEADGVRKTPMPAEDPLELPKVAPMALNRDSVVVATGGARGITAEVMKEVAATFGSRIYLLASTPVNDYPQEVFEGSDAEFVAGRAAFIRRELAQRGKGTSVGALNREFDRMISARTARHNIAEMEENSGKGRVTYLTCDVSDTAAVQAAISTVLQQSGKVDLVVSAAGLNRSGTIKEKDFTEFQTIRDLKVKGYRNLKTALRDHPPKMWCNFGSLLGYFGLQGELDYCSGNDFLESAANYCATRGNTDEFTMGWLIWDGVGIAGNELSKDSFERTGAYTFMDIAEGRRHFVQELHATNRRPYVFHIGHLERTVLVHRLYPGYFENSQNGHPNLETEKRAAPYLHRTLSTTDEEASFECLLNPTDTSVAHHRVRGVPTLPGSWVMEIAAEAAEEFVTDQCVIGFRDLTFENFFRVHPEAPPSPKRIYARVVQRSAEMTAVRVQITTDVVSPQGIVLARDKPLSSAEVLLASAIPAAPSWQSWPAEEEPRVLDPYHMDGSPVLLTGPFPVLTDIRLHTRGKRAHYAPTHFPAEFDSFRVPTFLLDAMVRTGVPVAENGAVAVAVPVSIRRIDLYQQANDRDVLAAHGHLELYATGSLAPSTVGDNGFGATATNRMVAATADGRIVAQVKDIQAGVVGHIDPVTGAFRETWAEPAPAR